VTIFAPPGRPTRHAGPAGNARIRLAGSVRRNALRTGAGRAGAASGEQPQSSTLARAAVAAGVNGVFVEVHEPEKGVAG